MLKIQIIRWTSCLSLIIALLVQQANSTPSFDKQRFCNCRASDDEDNQLPVAANQNINFPFIVSLGKLSFSLKFFTEKHKMETHLCSGVILNPEFVLTSASCINIYKNEFEKVGVGLNTKNDLIAIYDEGRIPIRNTIAHPKFDPNTLDNDIALVQLNRTISFDSSRFRPICLLNKIWFNKMKLLAWGNLRNLNHSLQSSDIKYLRYLKESNLVDISYIVKDCYTRPTRLCMRSIDRIEPNSTHITQNENGSPLFNQEDGRTMIVGLFSYYSFYSSSGNISQSIGVYTKIGPYLEFIRDHLSDDFCSI